MERKSILEQVGGAIVNATSQHKMVLGTHVNFVIEYNSGKQSDWKGFATKQQLYTYLYR